AVIEDACQTAWERLCAHHDVDLTEPVALSWLIVTATREAWRRARPSREQAAGAWLGEPEHGELAEPAGDASDPMELAIAHERHADRVVLLKTLSPRERRFIALHASGLSYGDIVVLEDGLVRKVV